MSITLQIKDLLAIPDIANFTSKIPILRLPENNYVTLNNQRYELRLFTFYMVKPIDGVTTFQDFVRIMSLEDKIFEKATQLKYIVHLYFAINDGNVYVNISLLPQNDITPLQGETGLRGTIGLQY